MLTLADLSVVIPVGPGDETWRALLPDLHTLPAAAEIFLIGVKHCVVPDDFDALVSHCNSRVFWFQSPSGRAIQQNMGVSLSHNSVLWFLHADSRLQANVLPMLEKNLPCLPGKLGYFDLEFSADGPGLMRLNALGANCRSRFLGLPFGDQGLFLMRSDFIALGQFDPTIQCGEDHDLVWRAQRRGMSCLRVKATITTSARKYAEQGWWRATITHLLATWKQARIFSKHRHSQ